ncbi:MAG: hypothetical protein LAT67_05115 [Balneolales bacterium]|nr:hypothetical protein [Balneolales bacterium]
MKIMFAKNPAGKLQILESAQISSNEALSLLRPNPHMDTSAENLSKNFKAVALPAIAVVGGQMGSRFARGAVKGFVGTNPTVRKAADIAMPFMVAMLLLAQKNKHAKMAGVGAGVDFVHTAFSHIAPMFGSTIASIETDPDLSDLRRKPSEAASGFLMDGKKPVSTSLGKAKGLGSGYLHDNRKLVL